MKRTWGILVLLCFLGITYSSELLDDLYRKNDLLHINLLRDSVFFNEDDSQEFNILENYYVGHYDKFIKDINNKYRSLQEVEPQLMFFYLASKYRLGDYFSLKSILPYIKEDVLSLDNWRDFQKIKAVSYYWDSNNVAINSLYAELKEDSRSNDKLLDSINELIALQQAEKGVTSGVSSDADFVYYLAWDNLKKGDYVLAYENFGKSLQASFVSTQKKEFINYGMGVASYASANKEQAIKYFSLNYVNRELKESAYFFKVLMPFDEKRYPEVVSSSIEFLAEYPNSKYSSQVQYLRGASLYFLGNKQQAKKLLEGVKDFSVFVKYLLAEIYYEEAAYSIAKTYYLEVQNKASDPLVNYAAYGLAWSSFKSAQYKEAEALFDKLSANKNVSEELRFNSMIKSADSSYNAGSYKDAEKKYRELLNKLAGRTDKYNALYKQSIYNLAKVYMKLKEFKKANELFEKYLSEVRNDKETVIIKTIIADNYYQLKNYQTASRIYEEILLIYKEYKEEDTYIFLADSYFNAKEYGKALVVYQDYLKSYPKGEKDMDARYGMVQTLYKLKDYELAKEQAKLVDEKYGIGLLKEIESKIKFGKETISE